MTSDRVNGVSHILFLAGGEGRNAISGAHLRSNVARSDGEEMTLQERAAQLYREALTADPDCLEAVWGLATLYAQLGRAGEALRACRQLVLVKVPAPKLSPVKCNAVRVRSGDRNRFGRRAAQDA